MSRHDPTPLSAMAATEAPGLRRALALLREEARSFPGPEESSAFAAATRVIERELARTERAGARR